MLVNPVPGKKTSTVSQVINEVITSVIQIKLASDTDHEIDSSKIEKNATYLLKKAKLFEKVNGFPP